MKEYIIHGTTADNLENILNVKYIEANINKKGHGVLDNSQAVNQIFTQLLYRNLPNENIQIPHWSKCCLVLDKKILKDYPFYATVIGGFYNKFSDAFVKNETNTFVKSKGNLTKMPNLKKLKEHIVMSMKNNQNISFIHSHEILFGKRISLKKYCKLIVYGDNIIPTNIILLASQLNIPIKQHINKKFVDNGLNNFIDIIEK